MLEQAGIKYHEILILVIAILLWKIVSPILDSWVRRFISKEQQEYVTVKGCSLNQKTCSELRATSDVNFRRELREDINVIKGILIVLASGDKPSMEELKELFK